MLLWIYCFRLFFIRTFVCLSISWSTAWNFRIFQGLFTVQLSMYSQRYALSLEVASQLPSDFLISLAVVISRRQLIYYTIASTVCQQLFYFVLLRLKQLFASRFRFAISLISISRVDCFVNNFFRLFWIVSTTQKICQSSERRRRDLNPRAAINDLHPFQGCPFGQLGYFSE